MIEAITSRDLLDPSATKWTPQRTATDPPPKTYVPVKDRLPPDPINKQCRRRRQHQTPIVQQNSAAALTITSTAVPPPKIVELTIQSPPTIVKQATPLYASNATKPHHLPATKSTNIRRRHRRNKTDTPQNSAAAHTDSLSAGPPPILAERTCNYFASSPPNIVEQATLLPTPIANKPHHLPPPTHDCTPEPTRHRLPSSKHSRCHL